jgi:hypothetical protein
MYALIASPIRVNDSLYAGRILSRHRKFSAMARAYERAQAPTRRASPGCYLGLRPYRLSDDGAHGIPLTEDESLEWFTAAY